MSKRYYVYKLIDDSNSDRLFQGIVTVPEQSNQTTMNDFDARSMVADAVIRQLIKSGHRPYQSHMLFCELDGAKDPRIQRDGDQISFDWSSCSNPQELELTMRDEE